VAPSVAMICCAESTPRPTATKTIRHLLIELADLPVARTVLCGKQSAMIVPTAII
jgi:hypothetical protein